MAFGRASCCLIAVVFAGCDCGGGDSLNRLEPELEVSPLIVDFGEQRVGRETTRAVTLKNVGAVRVSIGEVSLEDFSSFQIERGLESKDMAASTAATIDLSFVPGGEGAHETRLIIEADDPNAPHQVVLRG